MGNVIKKVGGCCLGCEERFPACHDVCATYLKAKAEHQEQQEIINKSRNKYKEIDAFYFKQVAKTKRYLAHKKGQK